MAGTDALHSELTGSNIHVPYRFTYADATAREAEAGAVPGDVGCLALQQDDNSLWMLTDDDPLTWRQVGYGSAPADHDHSGDSGDGGQFDAANLTSGAATDGQVLTADGSGGAAWEDPAGGGGAGDVTTDAIWDAAGDLAVGSGADTAARLAIGTADQVLRVNSGATAPEWASVGRVLISEQTSDGDESSITFSSIPAGYRDLYVEWVARSQRAAQPDSSLVMQFNGDTTGGNYRRATIAHYGTTVASQVADDAICAYLPAASAPANSPGVGSVHIKGYAGTTFTKVREGRYAYRYSAGSGNEMTHGVYDGEWENTAAITQIVVADGNSANFVSGSVFRLYGEY